MKTAKWLWFFFPKLGKTKIQRPEWNDAKFQLCACVFCYNEGSETNTLTSYWQLGRRRYEKRAENRQKKRGKKNQRMKWTINDHMSCVSALWNNLNRLVSTRVREHAKIRDRSKCKRENLMQFFLYVLLAKSGRKHCRKWSSEIGHFNWVSCHCLRWT